MSQIRHNNPLPPREELLRLLDYDPESGVLLWREIGTKGGQQGKRAGRVNSRGWRRLTIGGTRYKASRVIWRIMTGDDPGEDVIDHKNRHRDDDRWENLRRTSPAINSLNANLRKNNKTGFSKISIKEGSGKYRVSISDVYLGIYPTLEEAVEARERAILKLQALFEVKEEEF